MATLLVMLGVGGSGSSYPSARAENPTPLGSPNAGASLRKAVSRGPIPGKVVRRTVIRRPPAAAAPALPGMDRQPASEGRISDMNRSAGTGLMAFSLVLVIVGAILEFAV